MAYYLKNISIGEGQFDDEVTVTYNGEGYECSGFFPKGIIKREMLEVKFGGMNRSSGLAWVKPVQSSFLEDRKDRFVNVRLCDVVCVEDEVNVKD